MQGLVEQVKIGVSLTLLGCSLWSLRNTICKHLGMCDCHSVKVFCDCVEQEDKQGRDGEPTISNNTKTQSTKHA